MAPDRLTTRLGPIELRSPLIAASGTVGSVWEWAEVADVSPYGAAVAKSVAPVEWPGRPAPRLAPAGPGMLNGIGIQNPGIEAWVETMTPLLAALGVPVWGSAVGETPDEFAMVAKGLVSAGVPVIEVNLSCPNLEDGRMFSLDVSRSAEVVGAVAATSEVPVGAKLSPNTDDIVAVAAACLAAGATFLTLTNTILGFGIDPVSSRPMLSGGVGGYSGPGPEGDLFALCLRGIAGPSRSPDYRVWRCHDRKGRRGVSARRCIGGCDRHRTSRRATRRKAHRA